MGPNETEKLYPAKTRILYPWTTRSFLKENIGVVDLGERGGGVVEAGIERNGGRGN